MRYIFLSLVSWFLAATVSAQAPEPISEFDAALTLLEGVSSDASVPNANVAKAVNIVERLSREGDYDAMSFLAFMHANGVFGYATDLPKAEVIYRDALQIAPDDRITLASLNLGLVLGEQLSFGDKGWDEVVSLYRVAYADERVKPEVAAKLGVAIMKSPNGWEDRGEVGPLLLEGIEANQDDLTTLWFLARGYENGWYGEVDAKRSCGYYLRAANLGYVAAFWSTGMCYLNDAFGVPDEAIAFEWVLKSAKADQEKAFISTAVMLATGQGVEKNPVEAANWYHKAIEFGGEYQAHAMRSLGLMHIFEELGNDADMIYGQALVELAMERGDENASKLLANLERLDLAARQKVDLKKVELKNLYP